MAKTTNQLIAEALHNVSGKSNGNVINSKDLISTQRSLLVKAGYLKKIIINRSAILFLSLFLTGLIWWPITAYALSGRVAESPRLISSEIETEFLVVNKTLQVVRGDRPTIETDNIHLRSALKSKQIFMKEYDYSVTVSRRVYFTKAENQLELFDYSVRLPSLNKSLINEFSSLTNSEFIQTRIPLIKQPTTCYIFAHKVKLHLMCRYGLTRNDEILEIISRIKNEEM